MIIGNILIFSFSNLILNTISASFGNLIIFQSSKTDMELRIPFMEFFNQQTYGAVNSSRINDFIMIQIL